MPNLQLPSSSCPPFSCWTALWSTQLAMCLHNSCLKIPAAGPWPYRWQATAAAASSGWCEHRKPCALRWWFALSPRYAQCQTSREGATVPVWGGDHSRRCWIACWILSAAWLALLCSYTCYWALCTQTPVALPQAATVFAPTSAPGWPINDWILNIFVMAPCAAGVAAR